MLVTKQGHTGESDNSTLCQPAASRRLHPVMRKISCSPTLARPGNIRELQSVLQAAAVDAPGRLTQDGHIGKHLQPKFCPPSRAKREEPPAIEREAGMATEMSSVVSLLPLRRRRSKLGPASASAATLPEGWEDTAADLGLGPSQRDSDNASG